MKSICFIFCLLLTSCLNKSSDSVKKIKLPKSLKEISGIQYNIADALLWSIQDSGNENALVALNLNGEIIKKITISDVENIDWEDITADTKGNLYIGDFGNNDNTRKDLSILKINANSLLNEQASVAYKTSFYYPEQTDFPPKKKVLFYDCEAFIEMGDYFYLFTKNRSKGFDGTTLIYKIPNKEGYFKAALVGQYISCSDYKNCVITSAAISPNQKKIVLLGHNAIWLFENFEGDNFTSGTISNLDLINTTQKEALSFKDNETLLIADERVKDVGGYLYEYKLTDLKHKP